MVIPQIILFIFCGGVLLFYGADYLVKGGSHLARIFGISSLVIGLTIVAFGTSLPELVVSLVAALRGSESIAVGNVIGSNIANVGLVIGLSATLFHIVLEKHKFFHDLNFLLVISLVFIWMAFDGIIERWEGIILFLGVITYTYFRISYGKSDYPIDKDEGSVFINIFYVIIGIIGLTIGSNLFVDGVIRLAKILGVSEFVLGATVAAYGTSLPELTTSLVAAYRKEAAISIGNIIGSNIFNILCVIGLVSTINPLNVEISVFYFEIPVMLIYILALYPLLRMRTRILKRYSIILLVGYLAFVSYLFVR